MKKVTFLLAIAMVALICGSCTKTQTKGYYYYSNEFYINGIDNDISELNELVLPKLNNMMQLTNQEATVEWNSFMASASNISVTLNETSYYTVRFARYEDKNGQFVPVETVGEKKWGNGTAPNE